MEFKNKKRIVSDIAGAAYSFVCSLDNRLNRALWTIIEMEVAAVPAIIAMNETIRLEYRGIPINTHAESVAILAVLLAGSAVAFIPTYGAVYLEVKGVKYGLEKLLRRLKD